MEENRMEGPEKKRQKTTFVCDATPRGNVGPGAFTFDNFPEPPSSVSNAPTQVLPRPPSYVRGNVIANSSNFGNVGKVNLEVRTQFEQDETEDALTHAPTGDKNAFNFVTDSHFLHRLGVSTSASKRDSITQPDAGIYPASFGISQTWGGRKYQEDFYSVHVESPRAFFVFDGHGGEGCSRTASEALCNIVVGKIAEVDQSITDVMNNASSDDNKSGEEPPKLFTSVLSSMITKGCDLASVKTSLYKQAITSSILEFDRNFVTDTNTVQPNSGSTACGAVIIDDMVYTGNVGDSRLIMINSIGEIVAETSDHKVTSESEVERLKKANAQTTKGGTRLNGLLVARSLGHKEYKTTAGYEDTTIADPDVASMRLPEGATLICGTDGLWDHFSSAEVAKVVHEEVQKGSTCTSIARMLIENTLKQTAGSGGHDNITVIVYKNG